MENLQTEVKDKVQFIDFTLGKTNKVLESNNALTIKEQWEALNFWDISFWPVNDFLYFCVSP